MTRENYYKLVNKYNMKELKNNAIEMVTIGHYLEADEEIEELEAMVCDNHDPRLEVIAEYHPWGGVKYKLIPESRTIKY